MDMQKFPKTYDPKEWEESILRRWEAAGLSNPDTCIKAGVTAPDAPVFSVFMPPPNVTGVLHLGHALEDSLMDTVARYKRMRGFRTLFLPGVDHAAIATQAKVERLLMENEGIESPRQTLGREGLLERIRAFAEDSKKTILSQIRAMGASADWSRLAYTFDAKRSLAVTTLFEMMYRDGLIYRGHRVVNWSIKGQSTLSDDEVVHKEATTTLFTFRYAKDFPIAIATTRPETKLGDMGVAVHPDDERYKKYIGQTFTVNIGSEKPLSILIFSDPSIDKTFGTGAVGITPAHSLIDFDLWRKQGHKDALAVIGTDGRMTSLAGSAYAGLPREEARKKFVTWLKAQGLIEKEEEITHNVATSDRFGDVIEQLPLDQWFVDVTKEISGRGKSLKDLMRDAINSPNEKISFLPERFNKLYRDWVENFRDWCISRQIWWGHRIPIWYCLNCKHEVVNPKIKVKWFLVRHGETEFNKARLQHGHLDSPLTEEGKVQATRVAEQLKDQNIGLIISSDLGRCQETASLLAKVIGAPIELDPALRERSYGEADGLSYEEAKKRYGHPYASYDKSPGNIESPRALEERISAAFKKHKGLHGNKNVVIVSHGGSLRMLMKQIRHISFEEARQNPGIKNAEILSLDILATPCEKCGNDLFEQDPDTLDTWFSSATWPFSTLGWPEKSEDLKVYLPTSWMQMGNEIFLLWLMRMVLMTTYTQEVIPFREVYMHGILRDEKGQKFSKSLGNGIDPVEVIGKYGADALRITLLSGITPGNDMRFSMERVEVNRNLVNKLWNMGRYVASSVAPEAIVWEPRPFATLSPADAWILERLADVTSTVTGHLDHYQLSLAAETLRDFTWNDVADWYIETHKIEKHDAVLVTVFNTLLELWHPFMPFVTEAMFASLYPNAKFPLMGESWPIAGSNTAEAAGAPFTEVIRLVESIRNLRALYRIDPGKELSLTLVAEEAAATPLVPALSRLGKLAEVLVTPASAQPLASAQVLGERLVGYIHLGDTIDIPREKARLLSEQTDLNVYIERQKTKLADPNFTGRAPEKIVSAERERLATAETKSAALAAAISALS